MTSNSINVAPKEIIKRTTPDQHIYNTNIIKCCAHTVFVHIHMSKIHIIYSQNSPTKSMHGFNINQHSTLIDRRPECLIVHQDP